MVACGDQLIVVAGKTEGGFTNNLRVFSTGEHLGVKIRQAEPIEVHEENTLWEKQLLGSHTPKHAWMASVVDLLPSVDCKILYIPTVPTSLRVLTSSLRVMRTII